jgi:hypothetical protein
MIIAWSAQRLWHVYYGGSSSPFVYEDAALLGVVPPPPIAPDLTFSANMEADDATFVRYGTNQNHYL